MLLSKKLRLRVGDSPRAPAVRLPAKLGTREFDPRPVSGGGRGVAEGDCRICAAAVDLWVRLSGGEGQEFVGQIGGFSHESEHDLAVMVSDFLENGSGGAESMCSSDSDSGVPDLNHLAEKISFYKHSMDLYGSDLLQLVRSLLLSLNGSDHCVGKDGSCNATCIRQSLAKLLRVSGYDAAVCISKWQGLGKVPGGDHEYIDVVVSDGTAGSERLIIDIDFRSHFEIARAVESYDTVLNTLPAVFVGSWAKLKQFLQVMVEAAKCSLRQNSMPLPPWRSLSYLQAKWQSTYERIINSDDQNSEITHYDHIQCTGHLRRLKASLQSEIEKERLLKPIVNERNRRVKPERWRHPLLRS